jgi:DNA polymerase-3 subunit delta
LSCILLHGENRYLLRRELDMLKKRFLAAEGDFNLNILNGNETDEKAIIVACETPPFLGSKRLVIVRDWDFKKSAALLAKFIAELPEHCTLIITSKKADARTTLFKALKKSGQIKEFSALKPAEFKKWLRDEVQKQEIQIDATALDQLATFTLGDCEAAINELAKLKIYADGEKITRTDVETLVHPDLHTSVFRLTDAIGERQHAAALASLQDLVSRGENLIQIFFMIVRQFRILLQLQALSNQRLSQFEIARELKLHPFVVQNSMQQVRNFSEQELREAHKKLLTIDTAVKTGKVGYSAANPTEFASSSRNSS